MPKRILITGGSGLLALNWAIARKGVDDITLGLHQRQVQLEDVTATMISDEGDGALTEVIADIAPDIIIHTAAMTNVDQCQQAPDQAMQVNRDLSARVAKAAHDQGCKLVHISTDHLFTGDEAMLDETVACRPVNQYGESKWQGEMAVLDRHPDALILRVNFFGWGAPWRPSFSDWILSSLMDERSITLYKNAFFTPLYIEEVVQASHALLDKGLSGIFHVTSGQRISKFDFGMKLADAFDLDRALIHKGIYDGKNGIPRPLDMSLSNAKLMAVIESEPYTIDTSIARLKADHRLKEYFSSIDNPQ